jgi:hypothetical protein
MRTFDAIARSVFGREIDKVLEVEDEALLSPLSTNIPSILFSLSSLTFLVTFNRLSYLKYLFKYIIL